MRNKEKEEIPLLNIERNPLLLIISVLTSSAIVYAGYTLFRDMNPWGFMILMPAIVLSFQSLWLLLHPFAIIFEDKIEIKQSLFHHKDRYFIDIKQISKNKKGRLNITYKDDEVERLNLFGIKASHVQLLKTEVEKFLTKMPA